MTEAALLSCRALRLRWPAGFAVGPVDLELPSGVFHLQGRNGSGKTTLLRCLCGALVPDSGEVRVCGEDPADHRARRRVAWSPAECDLPGFLRVAEAWQLLAALRGRPDWDGSALMERLRLPARLRLDQASAGQRRAAGVLAALAGDPEVLLLDEPLANLDTTNERILGELITDIGRQRLVLITSHEAPTFPVHGSATLEAGSPLEWQV